MTQKDYSETNLEKLGQALTAIAVLLGLAAVVKCIFELVMKVWLLIKMGVIAAWHGAVAFGCAIWGAFMISLFLDLIFLQAIRWVRRRRAENLAVEQSCYPTLDVFRGVEQGSPLNRMFASLLAATYREIMGAYPDASTFRANPPDFVSFKSDHLKKLVRGSFRQSMELIFRQAHSSYLAGNEQLRNLLDPIIAADVRPSRVRLSGRVLNILSFRRLGFRADAGYIKPDVATLPTDWKYFSGLMRLHFFSNINVIEACVEFDVEIGYSPSESDAVIPENAEQENLEFERPVLMLPPPSSTDPIAEAEFELDNENSEEEDIDRQALEDEAVQAVDTVLGFFENNHQDKAWDSPDLLDKIQSVLCQAEEHHPEPLYVRSKIHWIQRLKEKRPAFDAAFEKAISAKSEKEAPDWFRNAIPKIGSELMVLRCRPTDTRCVTIDVIASPLS